MNAPPTPIRYQAVSMQLAAFLDGRYVEMQLLTDAGEAVAIACDKNSILSIGRHIRQLGRECPEDLDLADRQGRRKPARMRPKLLRIGPIGRVARGDAHSVIAAISPRVRC